jgi:predicted ATP-dependent endonuclease of OLD family
LKYEIKEEDLFLLKDNLVIKKELLESALNSFDNITDFLNEINMLIISLYSMYYIERFMPVISDTLNDFDNMNKQLDIFFNRPDKYKKSIGEEFEEFEKYLSLISNRFSDDETLESLLKYLSENTEEESYKELLTLYNNYLPYCGGIKINDLIKPEFNRLFSYTVEKLINIPIVPIGLPFVYLNAIKSSNERFIDFNGPKTKFMELIQRVVNNPKNLKKIKEFADKWLQEFEIGNKIDFDITRKPYHKKMEGVIIKITKNDNVYELSDLGFGASQIVTILLTIVTNFYENIETDYRASLTYAIEEPETNLHPKLQSKLADLFVEAIKKFRCQFIIETHSEYLIRKLQYLTAKKTLKPEDTVIYYFTEPEKVTEGRKQVERINILEDGNLDNDFGPGFFDEATNLKFDLLRLKNTQKN